jgi:hypothetical protein
VRRRGVQREQWGISLAPEWGWGGTGGERGWQGLSSSSTTATTTTTTTINTTITITSTPHERDGQTRR